jgi:hypothetical protein
MDYQRSRPFICVFLSLRTKVRSKELTVSFDFRKVIYVVTVAIFWDGLALAQGWIGGQWVWGTTLYLSALLTVLAKAALISE